MDWLQAVAYIVIQVVNLMKKTIVWHGITWWHIFISTMAFSLAITLFKFIFFRDGGSKDD